MHIAFITPEYPHPNFKGSIGGIGTFTKNLADELVKKGERVTVFVHSQNKAEVYNENGIEIHFVIKKRVKGITWYTNRRVFNKYVNKIILKNKIEVIEAPEWTGFTAFMNFKCPLLIRLHGSDTYFCDLENRPVKKKNKFFEKSALNGADRIIGVSDFVGLKTKELFGVKKEIDTIYNAISSYGFNPNHQQIKAKSLLYFGTLIRKKGVLEIAKMLNELVDVDDEVTIVLLGKDNKDIFTGTSTLGMIEDVLSEKAKQKVSYVEAVPYNQVINYIQQAEVVLLPSFAEAFPMTWLEAMSMEKKLITSNIGWAKELMIDGVTGFMIDPTNTEDFKNKTLTLLNNPEEADKMARNARQRIVDVFDMNKIIIENIKLYNHIKL
ncbi:glycosyltransferase family 4 protein [Polaribacter sp. AHE13PA]|uniref:glycosyltransferase family 4 protein n=1 Tax=Polaribacter sp. AHE13PA TaxID=2745562 RepID=UPI001C4FF120|nr:glycosyltransferase family 4 protein [Polaribacter sp. AHE13PA]QXP67495.1 glycosyltransferase family 4 protein [Polaribacter sp. AHE13PA]